jgi:hypothetical protein
MLEDKWAECATHEKYIEFWYACLKIRYHLEVSGTDGRDEA